MARFSLYLILIISSISFLLNACKKVEPQDVIVPTPTPTDTGINVPLTGSPHSKLSDYKIFAGALKEQQVVAGVYAYEPISSLFTDYALKKRFIWMPQGSKASYEGDGNNLNFPVGTILVKTFYYDHIQPGDMTKILETRIMIRQQGGWIFAEYVWNDAQTEAYLDMNGSFKSISWSQNGTSMSTNYRIPSMAECMVCHKLNDQPIPIGVKPQSLNKSYEYPDGAMNQLQKMVEMGFLDASIPGSITSVVDYMDESQSLDLRLRSYLDINCAHCHSVNKHCDYRPIRLAFSETTDKQNMGLCVEPGEILDPSINYILSPSNIERSMMHFRLSSNNEAVRMPLLGKSLVHQEGVDLLEAWINSIQNCE